MATKQTSSNAQQQLRELRGVVLSFKHETGQYPTTRDVARILQPYFTIDVVSAFRNVKAVG